MSLWQLWRRVHCAFKKKFGVEFRAERRAEGVSVMRVEYRGQEMSVVWDFVRSPGFVILEIKSPTVNIKRRFNDEEFVVEYIQESLRLSHLPVIDFATA